MENSSTNVAPNSAFEHSPYQIYTHHCLCNNLVIATTHTLSSLPRRSSPASDRAYILPSPPLPRRFLTSSLANGDDAAESDSESDEDQTPPANPKDFTLLVSLQRSPHPIVIRRSDGFEKRWLLRCGRCRIVAGYQLDWGQFPSDSEEGQSEARKGRRQDLIYILPGAIMPTEDMAKAKHLSEEDIGLKLGEG